MLQLSNGMDFLCSVEQPIDSLKRCKTNDRTKKCSRKANNALFQQKMRKKALRIYLTKTSFIQDELGENYRCFFICPPYFLFKTETNWKCNFSVVFCPSATSKLLSPRMVCSIFSFTNCRRVETLIKAKPINSCGSLTRNRLKMKCRTQKSSLAQQSNILNVLSILSCNI